MASSRLSVLVADDDQVLAQVLEAALKKAGWAVTIARDAMQAVMFAVRTPPDVIMLDITMPGGNGIAALQKLKASDKTRHIPVLVVSGTVDPALPAKSVELGAAEFWPKPVEPATLPQRLKAVIDATRVMRERVLDAVSHISRGVGADTAAVQAFIVQEHKTEYPVPAVEGVLEHLRTQRKVVKQQSRWFVA